MICLIIGTVLSALFIIMLFAGGRYDEMLKPLSGDDYPLKSIYSVGLCWQDLGIAKLRGKVGDKLKENASLLYSKKYREYYSRIIWAQVLSFAHLLLAVFLVIAGLFSGGESKFFLVVGIFACALSVWYFYTYTSERVKKRRGECETELPNAISKLALLVNSGVIVHDAWKMVSYGKDGVFYSMMKDSCVSMDNGKPFIDAIYDFGVLTGSEEVKKFTSALIQSVERGGGDLPQFLASQSSEMWARKRQTLLQKGEKAASALLMPIALMFFGVMLIVIASAVQSFSI